MRVNFRLEVRDYKGESRSVYTKDVDMSSAPVKGLNITQQDMVLTIDRLQYDLDEDAYYALIIENASDESWDFLTDKKHGWVKS